MGLWGFLNTCSGEMTGISFVDSTSLEVSHPNRFYSHKVFKDLAGWGKSSVCWYFGFKLHLIINDRGEILSFALTPGNTDVGEVSPLENRKPVPEMAESLIGKLFGDKGYISQALSLAASSDWFRIKYPSAQEYEKWLNFRSSIRFYSENAPLLRRGSPATHRIGQ